MNPRTMHCLQTTHRARTVGYLVQITSNDGQNQPGACVHRARDGRGCRRKAEELLNRIDNQCHQDRETPPRHALWHTTRRLERFKNADPVATTVAYNPDTRTTHSALGGIRIFANGQATIKARRKDPYVRGRGPARVNFRPEPDTIQVKISTHGSSLVRTGWENATAGIGVFYDNGNERNISLKMTSREGKLVSSSRAELTAILEALKQNTVDDLEIESDSLSSLRAICTHLGKYEDPNWSDVKNADILKGILIRFTRPVVFVFSPMTSALLPL